MKRYVIAVLLAVLWRISPAVADDVLIFSDEAFTDSTLNDNAPQTVSLYVVHTNHAGSDGIRFATAPSPGFGGVWISETSQYITIGTSTTDLSVGYGACLHPPILVLTVTYQFFGTSTACSSLSITPPTGFPAAHCTACIFEYPCGNLGRVMVNCPVVTESTTWGKVKALYRN